MQAFNQTPDTTARKLATVKNTPPPLSADPDEATAVALAAILDPNALVFPAEIFKEMARRNAAILTAPEAEIKATLARQLVLLEATANRLLQKAAMAPTTNAANEFTRSALATHRVLLQALGAVHAMGIKNADLVAGDSHADE